MGSQGVPGPGDLDGSTGASGRGGVPGALEAFVGNTEDPEQADFLELFAGCARMTEEFARAGYSVLEPRDILMGHDLLTEDAQDDVRHDLRHGRPHMVSSTLHQMVIVATTQLSWAQTAATTRADEAEEVGALRGGDRPGADETRGARGF